VAALIIFARSSGQAASNMAVAVGGGTVGAAVGGREVGNEVGILAVGDGGKTMFCTKAHAIVAIQTKRAIDILLLIVIGK
jgi:hypothetical protein